MTAEVQKLQFRPTTVSGRATYHVDHAAIRTSLERGGFTAAQLLSLHKAANLSPPMRVNAAGVPVPEKAKYQPSWPRACAAPRAQGNTPSREKKVERAAR